MQIYVCYMIFNYIYLVAKIAVHEIKRILAWLYGRKIYFKKEKLFGNLLIV